MVTPPYRLKFKCRDALPWTEVASRVQRKSAIVSECKSDDSNTHTNKDWDDTTHNFIFRISHGQDWNYQNECSNNLVKAKIFFNQMAPLISPESPGSGPEIPTYKQIPFEMCSPAGYVAKIPAVGLVVFSAYGTLKKSLFLIRYRSRPIRRLNWSSPEVWVQMKDPVGICSIDKCRSGKCANKLTYPVKWNVSPFTSFCDTKCDGNCRIEMTTRKIGRIENTNCGTKGKGKTKTQVTICSQDELCDTT